MNRYLVTTALAAALLVPNVATAQTAASPAATQQATATTVAEFVPLAAGSNLFEIRSSELALERAQNADVRDFAQHMIEDHTAAGNAMAEAVNASGSGVTVPESLDPRHQQMVDQLEGLPEDQFDAAYLQMQRQAHDEAVALFQGYSESGEPGPVRDFAATTLPTLEEHRQMLISMGSDAASTGATSTTPAAGAASTTAATGASVDAMSSDESGATTASSGEPGADPDEDTTPSGGIVPGQEPN